MDTVNEVDSTTLTINGATGSVLAVDASGNIQWSPNATSQMTSSYGNSIKIENGYAATSTTTSASYDPNNPYSIGTSSGGYVQGTITNYPSYPYTPIYTSPVAEKKDELKSDSKEAGPTTHTLKGIMRIYGDSVVIDYVCTHCEQVMHSEVISKVPKGIIEEKCLPRIVKGVK